MNLIGGFERIAIRLTNGVGKTKPAVEAAGPSNGFLLGTAVDVDEAVILDLAVTQHLYVVGASGSGKTTQIRRLLDADVAAGRTVLVLDHHGDLSALVLASLASIGVDTERVLYWNLADDSWLPSINPLKSGGEVHRRVSTVVGAIKRRADSWGVQLDETLRSIAIALAEQGGSLMDVAPALTNQSFRHLLKSRTQDEYARAFFERFEEFSQEQQQVQQAAVLNKLMPYTADPRMRRMLGTGDLGQLRSAVDSPGKVVVIGLPSYALGELAGVLGEMLLGAVWNTVLARAAVSEEQRNPVRLVVDEFQNAAGDQFGSMVTEARRFRMSLLLAHQSQAQVAAPLRSLIRNNSAVRLLMAPGVVDSGELAGELSPVSRTDAVDELMRLKTGEAYVVRRGEPAVKVSMPNVAAQSVIDDALARYIEDIQQRSCRSIAAIDAELAERARELAGLGDTQQSQKKEVRHGRKPWK